MVQTHLVGGCLSSVKRLIYQDVLVSLRDCGVYLGPQRHLIAIIVRTNSSQ